MVSRWYIGLASGSSRASVDASLVHLDDVGPRLSLQSAQSVRVSYPRDVRELLWQATGPTPPTPRQLAALHRAVSEVHAGAVQRLLDVSKVSSHQIAAIGSSGQVVWHEAENRIPAYLSLGAPTVLAERTGVTVISQFADRDLAASGLGEPITAAADYQLLHLPTENRLLINLGGVATLTGLPGAGGWKDVTAFQAAPCGVLLDGLMRLLTSGRETVDSGGKHAVQGRCLEPMIEHWLAHPFFSKSPPRTVQWNEFSPQFLRQTIDHARQLNGTLHDLLCTATHLIARSVVDAIQRFLPGPWERIVVSGGAVRNGLLWRLLEKGLEPTLIHKTDDLGVQSDSRKSIAFALLAALAMDGIPANISACTGATGGRLLGQFTPGSSGNWARCLAWMARQTSALRVAA